jgi:hypothetical protein
MWCVSVVHVLWRAGGRRHTYGLGKLVPAAGAEPAAEAAPEATAAEPATRLFGSKLFIFS